MSNENTLKASPGANDAYACMNELRWEERRVEEKGRRVKRLILQQLWMNYKGDKEWRDVPVMRIPKRKRIAK